MSKNLMSGDWEEFDTTELRLLLKEHFGGSGQYRDRSGSPNKLHIPLAGSSCWIVLTFGQEGIVAIEPGPAFDSEAWSRISGEIDRSLRSGQLKVGREFSFSSFRVKGSWRGENSGVQILPPPHGAPLPPVEIAEHPFVLEVPIRESDYWPLTNYRRLREHRKMTLFLNVLLAGRTTLQRRRSRHFWADTSESGTGPRTEWVQESYFAKLGSSVPDELSPQADKQLEEVDPNEYYGLAGRVGTSLRAPADLDESICRYLGLAPADRDRFDRAAYWLEQASRQWVDSGSSYFTALVSAIEALTGRGEKHNFDCPVCGHPTSHEIPGATRRFRDFIETYAPGSPKKRRDEMYALRSGVSHGSHLILIDQHLDFGWDPPWSNELELLRELSELSRLCLRNWLRDPSKSETQAAP